MNAISIRLLVPSLVLLWGITACDNPNTAEEAGRKLDQAVENAGEKVDEATEQMGNASDQAGVNVDDATITTKIKAAYWAESTIKSLDINVVTIDGVVTLSGYADSLKSSQKAEEIAGVVSEVKQVINQIIIN